MLVNLTEREFSHVLAALRSFASLPTLPAAVMDIATDMGKHEVMKPKELDELGDQLNLNTDLDLEGFVVVEVEGGIPQNVFLLSDADNADRKARQLVLAPNYRNENDCVQVFQVGPGTDEGGDPTLSNLVVDGWLEEAEKKLEERPKKKPKPRKR